MSLLDSEIELIDKISTKDLIIEWLKKYNMKNYKINKDLTIDVKDDIYLRKYPEFQLPDYIQFNEVNGRFYINYSEIETLKGCPKIVNGYFDCSNCKNLESLEGAPEIVNNNFYCYNCSNLKTFKGAPEIINGSFDCSYCKNLKSLKGSPKLVNKYFNCSFCNSLKSLKGAPKTVKRNFYCHGCPKLKTTEFDYKKYKITK